MFLDATAVYARVVERMRWLPDRDEDSAAEGDLPPREQKLLLMRLAALYGPDALAFSPRAPRKAADAEIRVVVGLQALTRAVAEVERLSSEAKSAGARHSYDEITQMVNPTANPDSVARRVKGSHWRMIERSETGCRLVAPAKDAPTRLGEMIAFQRRRELVSRHRSPHAAAAGGRGDLRRRGDRQTYRPSFVAQLDRAAGGGRTRRGRAPFFGIYLPAHPDNLQSSQRSLIGPDERFLTGGMVELDTGNARYLVRFTETIERQAGWSWALFNAVRKLSA